MLAYEAPRPEVDVVDARRGSGLRCRRRGLILSPCSATIPNKRIFEQVFLIDHVRKDSEHDYHSMQAG